jgi:hypothetical protein
MWHRGFGSVKERRMGIFGPRQEEKTAMEPAGSAAFLRGNFRIAAKLGRPKGE